MPVNRGERESIMIYRWKVGALAAASACALAAGAAAAADLTVTSFGGAMQDAHRKVYFELRSSRRPGSPGEDVWNGGVGAIRAKVEGGGQEWDVVQVEAEELVIGCEEGLYEPIDWEALGGKDRFIDAAVDDCGVGTIVWSTVIAYDGDKITADPPQSWADFWDTEKYRASADASPRQVHARVRAHGRRRAARPSLRGPAHRGGRGPRVRQARRS